MKNTEKFDASKGAEPSEEKIKNEMIKNGSDYYQSRETLRNKAYGGKPPNGYQSWGDYWKSY